MSFKWLTWTFSASLKLWPVTEVSFCASAVMHLLLRHLTQKTNTPVTCEVCLPKDWVVTKRRSGGVELRCSLNIQVSVASQWLSSLRFPPPNIPWVHLRSFYFETFPPQSPCKHIGMKGLTGRCSARPVAHGNATRTATERVTVVARTLQIRQQVFVWLIHPSDSIVSVLPAWSRAWIKVWMRPLGSRWPQLLGAICYLLMLFHDHFWTNFSCQCKEKHLNPSLSIRGGWSQWLLRWCWTLMMESDFTSCDIIESMLIKAQLSY